MTHETLHTEFVNALQTLTKQSCPSARYLAQQTLTLISTGAIQLHDTLLNTLCFVVYKNPYGQHAEIRIPHQWPTNLKNNPSLELGGVLFVSSKALDFYNNLALNFPKECNTRACAYEAEYLLHLKPTDLTTYQAKLLQHYPQGLQTPHVTPLLYTSKPLPQPN